MRCVYTFKFSAWDVSINFKRWLVSGVPPFEILETNLTLHMSSFAGKTAPAGIHLASL